MAEFVVYHHPERMGYPADSVRGFSLPTNKNLPSVVGSRVWLLTGEGSPARTTSEDSKPPSGRRTSRA